MRKDKPGCAEGVNFSRQRSAAGIGAALEAAMDAELAAVDGAPRLVMVRVKRVPV